MQIVYGCYWLICEFSICFFSSGAVLSICTGGDGSETDWVPQKCKKSLAVAEFDGFYRRCQNSSKSVAKAMSGVSDPAAIFKMARSPSLGML